jgi:hypothetical protein
MPERRARGVAGFHHRHTAIGAAGQVPVYVVVNDEEGTGTIVELWLVSPQMEDLGCGIARPLGVAHLSDHRLGAADRFGQDPALLGGGEVVPQLGARSG